MFTATSAAAIATNVQVNPLATKRVLRALAAMLVGQEVPASLTNTGDRQRIAGIQFEQIDAAVRQLRSRYPTVVMATRELFNATTKAAGLASTLVHDGASQAYGPAWQALVATLTRRIVIDGLAVARGSLDNCQAGLLELDTRDDLRPLDQTSEGAA
jgi:hypothetical protein